MPMTFDFTHKFLFVCLQHKNGTHIDFNGVAKEFGDMTQNAASLRFARIRKAMVPEHGDNAAGPDGGATTTKIPSKRKGNSNAASGKPARKRKAQEKGSGNEDDDVNRGGTKLKVEELGEEVVQIEEGEGV
ncbi:uncharacterized protein KY384_007601 [Bacidia gigantensis]|uniref:uncharacterized protein n=1 Tax=Bacidia gigantensis TaxID=2732470 RepID=UPI001D042FE3|nr:uncharacterized protein KY384_007601 [Bacidia gigantensis]KAG8527449.1 hypothetical protein KY384_007601 [Bacidia gigantensis]